MEPSFETMMKHIRNAWKKLSCRFGQPFTIQRAFRQKLTNCRLIKDAEGLRNLFNFLNACQDAIPDVNSLNILNDCEGSRNWSTSYQTGLQTGTATLHKVWTRSKNFQALSALEYLLKLGCLQSNYIIPCSSVIRLTLARKFNETRKETRLV